MLSVTNLKIKHNQKKNMHSMSWHQRNRNVNRFFFKRTGFFSPRISFSSQDVSLSPPASNQELHEAGDVRPSQQSQGGEAKIQQAKLRTGHEDEPKRLLLSSTGVVHGRGTDAPATDRSRRRVDHRIIPEELQGLPKE